MPTISCCAGGTYPNRIVAGVFGLPLTPCECIGADVPLDWDGQSHWIGGGPIGCGREIRLKFGCRSSAGADFSLDWEIPGCRSGTALPSSSSCVGLFNVFYFNIPRACCDGVPGWDQVVRVVISCCASH